MAGTPFHDVFAGERLPLRPRVRLPGGRLELATPIPQRPLVRSGEGRGKAETTNFQNDTQLVPRALPEARACQLFGWLLLPLLGTSQEGGAAPPCSPEPSHCPWAAVATAVCSLNGVYKPCPPTGRWLPSDNSKAVEIFTRQSLLLKTFLPSLFLF